MRILGISLASDTNFSLVVDGKVISTIEPGRYFRQKDYQLSCLNMNPGKHLAYYQYVDVAELEFFLSMVGKEWGTNFDYLAVQNHFNKNEYENLLLLLSQARFKFKNTYLIPHHLSHASLAFYTSPFQKALVFSYDGMGNDGQTIVFKGNQQGIDYIERNPIQFGYSYNNIGFIIGIKPDLPGATSGKTMGLTSYGSIREDWLPYIQKYIQEFKKSPPWDIEGVNNYGKGYHINSVGLDEIPDFKDFLVPIDAIKSKKIKDINQKLLDKESSIYKELLLPGPEEKLSQDLAKTVQLVWTEKVLELLKHYSHISDNLCVGGGCALNGITNSAIQQSGLFKEIHFVPNPSDCGLSAGAALYVNYKYGETTFNGYDGYFSPYLGQEPFDYSNLSEFKRMYPHRILMPTETPSTLAQLIYADRIVGVIRGRSEIGPRALGNRSILCNPLNPNIRDILNDKVKHREWYRPFAPVATAEDAHKYFTNISDIPYMSVICYTRSEYADFLPAITHVDGSSRLQTIRREHNSFLWDTLKEFERLSGVPIMLNTSFNPGGEPILNFCAVGLDMLNNTELDLVLIDNILFCRSGKEYLLNL